MNLRATISFVLCFISQGLLAQQQTLPIVKKGVWHLRKNGSEIRLPETYSYVHTFDQKGYAYFQIGGNYGIVSEEGKEIVPAHFRDVVALGNGYFKCQKDTVLQIIYAQDGQIKHIDCKQAKKLEDHWVFYLEGKQEFLLNTALPLFLKLDSTDKYRTAFDHVIFDLGLGQYKLFNGLGEKLFEGKAIVNYDFDYARFFANDFAYIFDRYGSNWNYPKNANFIDVDKEYIHYQLGTTAYLLNRETKKILFSCAAEQIRVLQGNYMVSVNGKNGIMNSSKKWLIQPDYDYFEFGESFITVSFNTLMGYYDKNYKLVVPCRFKRIDFDSIFFYTQSVSAYDGLISRKTGKEILAAVYDKIEIKGNLIKAKLNGNLMLLELNPNHTLKTKLVLENTISLRQKTRIWKGADFDPRLFPLGWYYDSLKGNANAILPNSKYKWGLKNEKDSILIKPTFTSAMFIPGAEFSVLSEWLNPKEVDEMNGSTGQNSFRFKYRMVDYTKGKILPTDPIEYLDTMDLQFRSFTRYRDTTQFGIVFRDNSIKKLTHLDFDDNEFIRYCIGGNSKMVMKKSIFTLEYGSRYLRQSYYLNFQIKPSYKIAGYEITGGKWNFFTSEGDSLFKEAFDFAEPFHKKTAIVYRHKNWGVVLKDSLVIPLQYNSIKRIREYKDSVFLVGIASGKEIFMDTNMQVISSNAFVFDEKKGSLLLLHENKKNVVINEQGERIYETEKSIKWHDFDRMVVKENKAYSIIDEKGQQIGEVKSKPEKFLSSSSFIVKDVAKFGVLSVNEDTLIPIQYKEIEAWGSFVVAKNPSKSCIYDSEYELIKCIEDATILVDDLSGLWAASFPSKVIVYDKTGKTVAKLKSNEFIFDLFYNGCFFSGANKTQALKLDGTWMELKGKKTDCAAFAEGYFGIEYDNKYWKIYNSDWKVISGELPKMKRPDYLGDGVISARSEGQMVLLDVNEGHAYGTYEQLDDKWRDELLLVKTNSKYYPYQFMNRSFENAFHRDFTSATAFSFGFASVCDERGCTLLNKRGFQKSYPSFNPMTVVGPNLVRTTEKMKYGIIDSQGHTIVKAEYDKINFLSDGLIQAIKEGTIFYFDMKGKVVY